MYIEFGPVVKSKRATGRFQFALKVGKGKTVAVSPTYGSRATALSKAKKLMNRVRDCDTVYEVESFRA